jgi:putative ABC transport system permease protein
MNNRYFLTLALQNISKHRQTYVPFMLVLTCFVGMYYILLYINESITPQLVLGVDVYTYLIRGAVLIFSLFAVSFLVYANGFLMRPRLKEYGLLYLFGLSQRHMMVIMLYELLFTFLIAISVGLFSGMLLSRLTSMILASFVKTTMMISQSISLSSVMWTVILFGGIMIVFMIINIIQINRASTVTLIHSSSPLPQSSLVTWLLLLCGIVVMVYGYSIAVTVDSSQKAYISIAPVLISFIIGTYCLFHALSIVIVRLLINTPTIFYKNLNMIVLNGLLHRIRDNATGLASVSMFSYIVLLIVVLCAVLYIRTEESMTNLYVADIQISVHIQNVESLDHVLSKIEQTLKQVGVTGTIVLPHKYLSFTTKSRGAEHDYEVENRTFAGDAQSHYIVMFTEEEYASIYGKKFELLPNEVVVLSSYLPLPDSFTIAGESYVVKERLMDLSLAQYDLNQLINAHYVIVHDMSTLELHSRMKAELDERFPAPIRYRFGINLTGTQLQKLQAADAIQALFTSGAVFDAKQPSPNTTSQVFTIQSRQSERIVFDTVYGTLLFLGLFIGFLYVISATIIIYYKQISEGYVDKRRFEILQQIGMSRDEVRASVNLQVVILFFIPLIVAGINFVMSMRMIHHFLGLFRVDTLSVLIAIACITFFSFSLMYSIIYRVTAKVYYDIVR